MIVKHCLFGHRSWKMTFKPVSLTSQLRSHDADEVDHFQINLSVFFCVVLMPASEVTFLMHQSEDFVFHSRGKHDST